MLDEVMQKPFKSVTEQVSILKSRGLTIKDEKAASRYLLFNNYYNVVNHFGKFFQDGSDCYISGASFDEIRYLFQLDKEIKSLLFRACLDIEKSLKSLTAYYYSEQFRAPYSYLDQNNYQNPENEYTQKCINKLQDLLQQYQDSGTDNAISHYVKNYGHVPLWVLTNVMDFGTINSLYKNMPFTVQNNVAKCFSDGIFREYHTRVHLPPNYFWKFMYAIQELRNTCGHNNRLLNHNFKYSVPFISFLYSSDYERSLDRSHVYDIYLATKLFLPKKQFDDLTRAIKKRMRNYLKSRIKSIPCTVILDSLGFPSDWID